MKTKPVLIATLAAILFAFGSCMNPNASNMATEEKNKETAKKVFEMFSSNSWDNASNYITEDVTEHSPDPNIKATGLEGVKETSAMYHTSFPDMKMNVMNVWADGDMVFIHNTFSGTNTGMMGEMPATNKSVDINGIDIFKFNKEGKVTDHWGYFEEGKFMTQLGMMPGMNEMMNHEMAMDSTAKM